MLRDLQQRLAEAFLSHRLNRSELVRASQAPEALDTLLDPATDLRDPVPAERVDRVMADLGLDREFRELDEDAVWTPYQRALYRRLSVPQNDPAERPAPPAPGRPDAFVDAAMGVFEQWDRNHDTRLDTGEIDRVMEDPDLTPAQAAAAVVLRSYTEALGSANPDDGPGVTKHDLRLFVDGAVPGLDGVVAEDFSELHAKAASLPPAAPLAEESRDPFELRQNRLGACVMLSTAAGMSESELAGLVTPAPDGGAVVHFRDGEEELVYELTTAERLFHATGEDGARWPGLLEVAMGQRLARKNRGGGESARGAADGIPPEEALEALTGRTAARLSLDEISLNETRRRLADLCSRPGPRICGSRPNPILKGQQYDVEALHNGIQNSHAYTLLGYDEASDTVRLRNPWHSGPWIMASDPGETGVFEMPTAQFYSSFRWIVSPAG